MLVGWEDRDMEIWNSRHGASFPESIFDLQISFILCLMAATYHAEAYVLMFVGSGI